MPAERVQAFHLIDRVDGNRIRDGCGPATDLVKPDFVRAVAYAKSRQKDVQVIVPIQISQVGVAVELVVPKSKAAV